MKALYKHEMSSYLTSPIGYIVIALLVMFGGIFTSYVSLKGGSGRFEYVLGNMSFVYIIIIPVLTMRSFAEERRQKTDQLLYSLPLSSVEVVLAKYLAMLTVLLIPIVIVGLFPLILMAYGTVNFVSAYAALGAFYLLGMALIAVGMFISSVTDNQIVAAVITLGLLLLNYFLSSLSRILVSASAEVSLIGFLVLAVLFGLVVFLLTKNWIAAGISSLAAIIAVLVTYFVNRNSYANLLMLAMDESSLFGRMFNFMYETFRLVDAVVFLGVAVVFTVMTVQSLEKRRWSA